MLAILRDLLRYNLEFRIGIVLVGFVLVLSMLSGFSPYPPQDVYVVLAGVRGQDAAEIRVTFNPLVRWVWLGGALMAPRGRAECGARLAVLAAPGPTLHKSANRGVHTGPRRDYERLRQISGKTGRDWPDKGVSRQSGSGFFGFIA